MKKLLAWVMVLVMCVSLCACGSVTENVTADDQKVTEATPTERPLNAKKEYVVYTFDGVSKEDLFTIEEIVLSHRYEYPSDPKTVLLQMDVKIRNTSGTDLEMPRGGMQIWSMCIDDRGDIVETTHDFEGGNHTIKNGQAEWINCHYAKDVIEETEYISIYAYSTYNVTPPEYEFANPIMIRISDYIDWNEIK